MENQEIKRLNVTREELDQLRDDIRGIATLLSLVVSITVEDQWSESRKAMKERLHKIQSRGS